MCIVSLTCPHAQQTDDLAQLKAKITTTKQRYAALKSTMDTLDGQLAEATKKVNDCTVEISKIKPQFDQATNEMNAADEDYKRKEKEIKQRIKQKQREKLEAEQKKLQDQLKALEKADNDDI